MTMRTNGEIINNIKKDLQELADFYDLYKFDICPATQEKMSKKHDTIIKILQQVEEFDY